MKRILMDVLSTRQAGRTKKRTRWTKSRIIALTASDNSSIMGFMERGIINREKDMTSETAGYAHYPAPPFTVDSIHRYHGIEVRIIAVDSDPRSQVHVCSVNDPDHDMFVDREDLW